jgi:hypothetical protein
MNQYRIYTFRDDGHFAAVKRLECANQKEAVQKARQLVDGQDGELWECDHCQRRCNDASAGRSKNTSMMLARGPNAGPFRPVSDLVEMIRRRIGTGTV